MTAAQRRYLWIETGIATTISAVLSGVFVLLVFGGQREVPIGGIGGLIVDALPQTLMIALMSSLVPTLLTRRRARRRSIAPLLAASRWASSVALRVVAIVLVATTLGGAFHAILMPLGPPTWPLQDVLAFKIAYGAALGMVVAKLAVAAALHDPVR